MRNYILRPRGVFCKEVFSLFQNEVFVTMEEAGHYFFGLEPGDGTHYEFLLWWKDRNALIIAHHIAGWCVEVGRGMLVPSYLQEKTLVRINDHTKYLVCDLVNQWVFDGGPRMFDWEKAKAIWEGE